MKVKWFGHSGFLIDDLCIDPFISGNSKAKDKVEDIKCKVVCVTHGHADHLGDAIEIAKRNDATLVAIHELAVMAAESGVKSEGMSIGGQIEVEGWKIKMEMAFHSGTPTSFILKKNGKTIYHAGDTGYFSDMERFKEYDIDVALIPIGDRYTMGAKDAAKCVKSINCKKAVPMHYGTFPIIDQTPEKFVKLVPEAIVFEIGEEKEM